MNQEKYSKPFIGFVRNEKEFTYEVHLINPTGTNYARVFALTGAFCGDEDGLLETSKVTREEGELLPHTSILLEGSDMYELDFVIWYHLDLYHDSSDQPNKFWFSLPKYAWRHKTVKLPIIDKEGILIELDKRMFGNKIEDEVKNMNMEGEYHKSEI